MDFLSVECRAFSPGRREHFVAHGVVDNTEDQLPPARERHRNTKTRIPVRKIRGAVQRIHVPAILGIAVCARPFFGGNGVAGEIPLQPFDNDFLRAPVSLCYKVKITFIRNIRRTVDFLAQDFAGFPRDFDCHIEVTVAHARSFIAARSSMWFCAAPYNLAIPSLQWSGRSSGNLLAPDSRPGGTVSAVPVRCGRRSWEVLARSLEKTSRRRLFP